MCDACGLGFFTKAKLKAHWNTHSEEAEQKRLLHVSDYYLNDNFFWVDGTQTFLKLRWPLFEMFLAENDFISRKFSNKTDSVEDIDRSFQVQLRTIFSLLLLRAISLTYDFVQVL